MVPNNHRVALAKSDAALKEGGTTYLSKEIYLERSANNYDSAFYQTANDHVFLLSVQQLKNWVHDQRAVFGSEFVLAKPTKKAAELSASLLDSDKNNADYWLNTPDVFTSTKVRLMNANRYVYETEAYRGNIGVRPALQLNSAIAKFNSGADGSAEEPYQVVGIWDTQEFVGDKFAPSIPQNLKSATVTSNSISLNWSTSTDNVGVTKYEIFQDNLSIATVIQAVGQAPVTSYTVRNLKPASSYSFFVKAIDAAGNRSFSSQVLQVKTAELEDQSAPTKPLYLRSSKITSNGLFLQWNASVDNKGVVNYVIYQDGKEIATIDGKITSYQVKSLKPKTLYRFSVQAKDAVNNLSAMSDSHQVTTIAARDSVAPSSPTKLAISAITGNGLTLTWSPATDNVKVHAYDIYRNGRKLTTVKTTTYKVTGLIENAVQSFYVVAVDEVGNRSVASTPATTKPTVKFIGNFIFVNFKQVFFNNGASPTKLNGQTMVTFKPFLEAMALKVSYDSKTQTISATKAGFTLQLTQNKAVAIVNGKNKTMPVAPTSINGNLRIPLEFIANELGYLIQISK
jgi:chitodextrinase